MASRERGELIGELIEHLESQGCATLRASGKEGNKNTPLPDVFTYSREWFLAINCKYALDDIAYFDIENIGQLIKFSQLVGARPRVAVKYESEGWKLHHPGELIATPVQNYRVGPSLIDRGDSIEALG